MNVKVNVTTQKVLLIVPLVRKFPFKKKLQLLSHQKSIHVCLCTKIQQTKIAAVINII